MRSTRLSQDKSSTGPRWPGFVEFVPQNVPKFWKVLAKFFFFPEVHKSSELLSHSHVEMHRVANCFKFP